MFKAVVAYLKGLFVSNENVVVETTKRKKYKKLSKQEINEALYLISIGHRTKYIANTFGVTPSTISKLKKRMEIENE